MKKGAIVVTLFFCLSALFVQADQMEDIRRNREQTLKELDEAGRNLKRTLKKTKNSLNELKSITADIHAQKKLIGEINGEIKKLNRQQQAIKDTIYLLNKDLTIKKKSYAEAVRRMSYRQTDYEELAFVFSASSLNESFRRARYLKEYSNWRKQQAEEIVKRRQQLEEMQVKLNASIAERNVALKERQAEADVLKKQERIQQDLVTGLKKQEQKLRREIEKKNKAAKALERKLEKLIAEEQRKAAARAQKEGKRDGSGSSKQEQSYKGYKMPKADVALAGSFAKNKGKLPPPLSGRYKVVDHYGVQQHPNLPNVKVDNHGVNIETVAGTKARAVFDGVVACVFVVPGYNSAVMVRHGNYFTLYVNLDKVYVKDGDKVKTGQDLGRIYSDPEDGNRTVLTFQVWKEQTKLNPELWINL